MQFLNNLKQTVSFTIMSALGYFLTLDFLILVFWIEYVLHNIHYEEYNIELLILCKVFLEKIFLIIPVIVLILLITGIFEYKKKKENNKFEERNNNKNFLFIAGLIPILGYPLAFLIISLLNYIIMTKQYTLL